MHLFGRRSEHTLLATHAPAVWVEDGRLVQRDGTSKRHRALLLCAHRTRMVHWPQVEAYTA